jgi:hypothetical protein
MSADPVWMKALLTVHVACGFGAFLLAPVALSTAKGGKQHRRWGMVYLWAMGGVAGYGAADGAVSAGTVSGDCVDYGVLQAEVCAAGGGGGGLGEVSRRGCGGVGCGGVRMRGLGIIPRPVDCSSGDCV